MNKYLILLSLFFSSVIANGQNKHFKNIEVKGDYIHDSSKIKFPLKIENFERVEITGFDSSEANVGISYFNLTNKGETKIDIYVYPGGMAYENRLKDEYFKSLKAIATLQNKEIHAVQHPFIYTKNKFRVVGIKAYINDSINSTSDKLILFECGKWFLKYRISSNCRSESNLDSLMENILEIISPIETVRNYPLKPNYKIIVAPAAMKDTVLLHAVLAAAFKKNEWFKNNVDSLESLCGVPGLYLDAHTSSLVEFVNDGLNTRLNSMMSTNRYYQNLKKIIDKGYLNEFVMDQYGMVLFTSPSLHLNIDEYRKWAHQEIPGFNLNTKYFLIEYSEN